MAQLRTDVATLSIDLAGRIVERNLDSDTNRQLVDSFIDQVAGSKTESRGARRGRAGRGPRGKTMTDRIEAWAQALLEIAQAEDHLSEVEDELFRFARIVEGNDDLRMALSNPGQSAERRARSSTTCSRTARCR